MKAQKDAYWFSHDSNAKDDPKIMLLIDQLGLEGYGIYWVLIETLRDQPDYRYKLIMLPILAKRYGTSTEKTKAVVLNYELFTIQDDEFFFSESLLNRMNIFEHRRLNAQKAGIVSALKRKNSNECSTDVQRSLNEGSTIKVKESKVNEIKVKDSKIDFASLENFQWFNSILVFLEHRINETELQKYWKQYQVAMTADDDLYRDKMDYRSHFRNWVKIQVDKTPKNGSSVMKPNYSLLNEL